MMKIPYIGFIKSTFSETNDPELMPEKESELLIDEKFSEGLFILESNDFIAVFFRFHKSEPINTGGFHKYPNRLNPTHEQGIIEGYSPSEVQTGHLKSVAPLLN